MTTIPVFFYDLNHPEFDRCIAGIVTPVDSAKASIHIQLDIYFEPFKFPNQNTNAQ